MIQILAASTTGMYFLASVLEMRFFQPNRKRRRISRSPKPGNNYLFHHSPAHRKKSET